MLPINKRELNLKIYYYYYKGDNRGITIKIRDNWYYYEASF